MLINPWQRFVSRLVGWWCRPNVRGLDPILAIRGPVCFVLAQPATTDVGLLNAELQKAGFVDATSWVALNRYSGWPIRRVVADATPSQLSDALASPQVDLRFCTVSIFWSRAAGRLGSLWRLWLSERWAATGRFRRLLMLTSNRRDVLLQFGPPLSLAQLMAHGKGAAEPTAWTGGARDLRRLVRLFRTQLRAQRRAVLGPDLSHRRTLVTSILYAEPVRAAIRQHHEGAIAAEQRARRYAQTIASDMSYPVIRFFDLLLTWLWQRLYDGVDLGGFEHLEAFARTHALVYVPSHRSHMDYLLLSYALHHRGLAIPHIAAGDNLNLPILGGLLRRAGAFFIRRSFRDDPLYAAVLNEYVWRMSSRGHSMEYFIEGGRSRTGRLLAPRPGLLAMTVAAAQRGGDRPIALVPVYFGYEHVMEERSYLNQLRGQEKTKESWFDIFRVAGNLRRHHGRVAVNFGKPVVLEDHLDRRAPNWRELDLRSANARSLVPNLGRFLLAEVNRHAAFNSRNLIALVLLATPKGTMEASGVAQQVDLYIQMARRSPDACFSCSVSSGNQAIGQAVSSKLAVRSSDAMGDLISLPADSRDIANWYRNNVLHVFAIPGLISALVIAYGERSLEWMLDRLSWLYPYFANDLQLPRPLTSDLSHRWIEVLQESKVLVTQGDRLIAPAPMTEAHAQASLLGRLVLPSIERYYTMISVLRSRPSGSLTSNDLIDASTKVLQRLERLYGFDSPEFLDATLCSTFVHSLVSEGWCHTNEQGCLTYDAKLAVALREAAPVVRPDYRYALWQLRRGLFGTGTAFVDAVIDDE